MAGRLRAMGQANYRNGFEVTCHEHVLDAPLRWPYAFLENRNIPEDFKTAMSTSLMRAGPELQISNMVPRPIDLGLFPELADDTLDALNRRPLIKALVGWLIFLAILTYLFWTTR